MVQGWEMGKMGCRQIGEEVFTHGQQLELLKSQEGIGIKLFKLGTAQVQNFPGTSNA